jgi:hypothetical protein
LSPEARIVLPEDEVVNQTDGGFATRQNAFNGRRKKWDKNVTQKQHKQTSKQTNIHTHKHHKYKQTNK